MATTTGTAYVSPYPQLCQSRHVSVQAHVAVHAQQLASPCPTAGQSMPSLFQSMPSLFQSMPNSCSTTRATCTNPLKQPMPLHAVFAAASSCCVCCSSLCFLPLNAVFAKSSNCRAKSPPYNPPGHGSTTVQPTEEGLTLYLVTSSLRCAAVSSMSNLAPAAFLMALSSCSKSSWSMPSTTSPNIYGMAGVFSSMHMTLSTGILVLHDNMLGQAKLLSLRKVHNLNFWTAPAFPSVCCCHSTLIPKMLLLPTSHPDARRTFLSSSKMQEQHIPLVGTAGHQGGHSWKQQSARHQPMSMHTCSRRL